MKKIEDTLNDIISAFDGNKSQAAKFVGLSKSFVTQVTNGTRKINPPYDAMIQAAFERLEKSSQPNARIVPLEKGLRRVPVVASMRAGFLDNIAANYDDIANQIDETVETDCRDENAYALIVEGDSMEPRFQAGDRVILAPNFEPRNGDPVCARLAADGRTFFKILRQKGEDVTLESLNPAHEPLKFKRSEFRFIHPAVDLKAKLRR